MVIVTDKVAVDPDVGVIISRAFTMVIPGQDACDASSDVLGAASYSTQVAAMTDLVAAAKPWFTGCGVVAPDRL